MPLKDRQIHTENNCSVEFNNALEKNVSGGDKPEKESQVGLDMLSGTAYISLTESINLLCRFVTAVFLARYLGPTNFGYFMLAATFIIWLELSIVTAFAGATIKHVGESRDWHPIGSMVLRLHLTVSMCVCLLLWLMAEPLSVLFKEAVLEVYLKWFGIEIPIFALARAQNNIILGRGLFRERAYIGAVYSIARLFLIVLFVTIGFSVEGAIMGSIAASLIELLAGRRFAKVSFFHRAPPNARDFWRFVGPLFLSNLSLRLFRLDLFALKALGAAAAQAGFYSAATGLSLPPYVLAKSVSPTMLSTLSRLMSHDEVLKAKEIGASVMRSVCWFLPFVTMVSGMASEIVVFVFGPVFAPAGPIFSFLIFSALSFVIINIAQANLTAMGKPMWALKITSPMIPYAFFGHLLLVPRFGPIGAAIVTTSGACLAAIVAVAVIFRTWGLAVPVKTIFISSLSSVFALIAASMWTATGITVLIKMASISVGILICFIFLGEFKKSELNLVGEIVKSRLGIGQKSGRV